MDLLDSNSGLQNIIGLKEEINELPDFKEVNIICINTRERQNYFNEAGDQVSPVGSEGSFVNDCQERECEESYISDVREVYNGNQVHYKPMIYNNVSLRNHIVKEKVKHSCPICHTSVYNLKSHMLTHSGRTPYRCSTCNKQFYHQASLMRHRLFHTGERPYECTFCEKTFIEPYKLKLHLNLHSGETVFKCNVCRKEFKLKSYLRSHIVTHYNKRDFKCDVCKREFKRKDHLKRHILIHTGEKSYVCAECDRAFRTKWHLQRHILRHEQKIQPKC